VGYGVLQHDNLFDDAIDHYYTREKEMVSTATNTSGSKPARLRSALPLLRWDGALPRR
jgi:hypothetical protein